MNSIILYDAEYWADKGSLKRQWQGPNDHPPYLVQLSAFKVKLDQSLTVTDTLSIFTQPVDDKGKIVPITPYFEKLTNISQQRLQQNAIPIDQAFKNMQSFFKESLCYSYGRDERIMTISAHHWKQKMPMQTINCRDVRDLLRRAGMREEDIQNNSSGQLTHFHNLPFTGHVHDAADDVKSIHLTLQHYLNLGKLSLSDFK